MPEQISVRDYLERVLEERDKRLDERWQAQEKAVRDALLAAKELGAASGMSAAKAIEKAEGAQQRVNDGQNEFRETLRDQAATLMPRSETELLIKDVHSQLDLIRGTRREGIGLSANAAAVIVTILIAVSAVILTLH